MAREYEELPYRFTNEELLALGQQLAHSNQEIYNLRAERVSAVASLAASIKAAEKRSADLTQKIETRSEMRSTEVMTLPDTPRRGLKTIARVDTHEEVRVCVMTAEELQGALEFGSRAE